MPFRSSQFVVLIVIVSLSVQSLCCTATDGEVDCPVELTLPTAEIGQGSEEGGVIGALMSLIGALLMFCVLSVWALLPLMIMIVVFGVLFVGICCTMPLLAIGMGIIAIVLYDLCLTVATAATSVDVTLGTIGKAIIQRPFDLLEKLKTKVTPGRTMVTNPGLMGGDVQRVV